MDHSQDHLEVEVKFHLKNPEEMCKHIIDLGATARPKHYELNLRFDDAGQTLTTHQKLLRLRSDNGCRLTFKSKPSHVESECKVFRELEVTVNDFDAMKGILNALGFHAVQTYEKWRQVFTWKNVEMCIDTLPYGSFLEIEGPETGIKETAAQLNLPWNKRILANYLAIFESIRTKDNLPFQDVTFANFAPYPTDLSPLLGELEAG